MSEFEVAIKIAGKLDKSLQTSVSSAQKMLGSLGKGGLSSALTGIGNVMESTGKALTTGVTMPVIALGATSVKEFGSVDKSMKLVQATMGSTDAQAKQLESTMKKAAANSVFGMQDAADATLNFARQGFNAKQAGDMLTPALNLAAGTATDLSVVTGGLGNAMKMFGKGRPLEERPQRDIHTLLEAVLKNQNIRLQIADNLPDKIQAQYIPNQRTIYIRNGMSEITTFHAINRELACAALDQHDGNYARNRVNAQAFCATYILGKRYGVDVSGFDLEKVAGIQEHGQKDPQELRLFLNDVRTAAYGIRGHIERNLREPEQQFVTEDTFTVGESEKKSPDKGKKSKNEPER